ncbi:unnamed protein product [Larinioides sclopetarius]|uniref:Uncharacterized protein n=1 Tax=Larinioides sclopetarius TaxID=280406 RepID=A0AAV1ZQS3_9ARAC
MAEKYLQKRQICQRGQESTRMDDIIKDTIIVSKIKEKDTNTFKEIEEGLIHDGNIEKEQIAAEYEAIVKKQLQMLQADERGRQALQNEIAEIRRKQEKRADALKARAKALEIEKDRAKRIANRPPPLPRSVRLLLKEQAKKDHELVAEDVISNISPSEGIFEEDIENSEDKENIDEEYLAEKRKMQEEWNKKAKKRFNEALKKDRQKQEHDAILKDIENAERLNRRQMARNISEPTGEVPNYLPDKLHHAEKQVAMEDAVENIFKKKNPKEHAVEDLEGYQDKWEAKYKQLDSVMESKMIDCVPSFVKENYSYLLQEETTLQCGKRFSGLDDSSDDLNMAYIESPPADVLNNSKEIDAVISQLDQMRIELNEAYEKEFKPLLETKAAPKIVLVDKSVETDILKLPTEDKAIEVERTPPKKQAPSSSRSVQVDILQGGVMSYQRRHLGNMYRSHTNNSGRYLPESFACQLDTTSEVKSPRSAIESWSSSSYWSLPSKHGLPNVCKYCDSPGCTIPLVEDEKLHKDCVPLGKSLSKQSVDMTTKSLPTVNDSSDELVKARHSSSDELHSSSVKSKLTSYIQLVADKYLKKSTTSPEALRSPEVPRVGDETPPKADSKEPIAISKSKISEYVDISGRLSANTDPVQTSSVSSKHFFRKQSVVGKETSTLASDEAGQPKYDQLGLNMLKSSDYDLLTNMNSSGEDELLKNCREFIAANLSDVISPENRIETVSADVSHSSDQSASPDITTEQHYKKESLTGYVYHDLSTIPEMDSVLTNDTKETSLVETRGSLAKKSLPEKTGLEDISPDEVDTTSASLVDAPISEVSEIAKSIQFIRKLTPEPVGMDDTSKEHAPFISDSLSNLQTPKNLIPNIQFLPDDQISSFSSIMDAKTSDGVSGSSGLLTPSPVPTLKSVSATKPQVLPYSSSLRDSKAAQSPLTSSSALSKYFQDISSIRHVSETSFKSYGEAPFPVQMDIGIQAELLESSLGTSLPMTPHSYMSTQGSISGKQKYHNVMKMNHLPSKKSEVFKTPDSNLDSFKPLSLLMSDVSTPKETSVKHANIISNEKDIQFLDKLNKNYQCESSTSSSNFQPMTPHTYFSNISQTTSKYPSESMKNLSPSKDSSQVPGIDISSQKNIDDSNLGSFKPLSLLMSDVSTPKDAYVKHTNITSNEKDTQFLDKLNEKYQYESSAGSSNFQPMTPHSNFLSIDQTTPKSLYESIKNFSPRKDGNQASGIGISSQKNIDDSNLGSYKPLSLLMSDVSTPKDTYVKHTNIISNEKDVEFLDKINEKYQYESSAGSSYFQPMTPHSYFSSPSDIPASSNYRLNEFSVGKELKEGSVNLRLKIPIPLNKKAFSPTNEELEASGDPKSFTYPIRLKLDVKDFANPPKNNENCIVDDSHVEQGLSKDNFKKGNPSKGQMLSSKTLSKNYTDSVNSSIQHTRKEQKAVKVTSSGFVPHFSPEDFTQSEKNQVDGNKQDLLTTSITNTTVDCKGSLKNSASVINNDLKNSPNVASSVEHERGCFSSSHFDVLAPSTSPNPILQALAQQLASSSSKLCTPCATPSNGSSTENLSEMFAESRITYQSTPVKSIEELIQETGILEEPSLTLMNTEITIRPDSPEKSRLFSEGSLLSEDFKTPSSLQSAFLTPDTLDTPSGSASSPYYCDSPSLISFMKHEQSCLTSGDVGEKKLSSEKTSQNEYKKRTKRLWNNLEEVRTKKLLEERKEQMRKNRLKMKSYSKKAITPKKK